MIRALYTAASGMSAQQTNLDTVANNLANSATTGFRQRQVQFRGHDLPEPHHSGFSTDPADSFRRSPGRPRNQIRRQRSDHDARRLQPDEWSARPGHSRRRLLPDIPPRRNHRLHQSRKLPSEQSGNTRDRERRYSPARDHYSLQMPPTLRSLNMESCRRLFRDKQTPHNLARSNWQPSPIPED